MPVSSHDPERFVQLLRDHLAAHDKRLVFLFGAGTSCAINVAPAPTAGSPPTYEPLIPAVGVMTTRCREAVETLSPDHAAAWSLLDAECAALKTAPHIESILGRLRLKIEASGPTDSALGLDQAQLAVFERTVRDTIAALASPPETAIPASTPHDSFARWVRHARRRHAIEVFTTNYDILLERSLERARVPIFDGFVGSFRPFFNPDALEGDLTMPGRDWIRVWKLHGSTNWRFDDTENDPHVVRLSETGRGEMILPSHRKYDESRKMPYVALMDRFATCLAKEGALLVTCGYSWSDQHVNAAIFSALGNQPANGVIALMCADLDNSPELVSAAGRLDNVLAIGPRDAILRGQRRAWGLPHPIERATASFLDPAFDSDARPDPDDGPIPGTLRLGDFQRFCNFLAAMSPEPTT